MMHPKVGRTRGQIPLFAPKLSDRLKEEDAPRTLVAALADLLLEAAGHRLNGEEGSDESEDHA